MRNALLLFLLLPAILLSQSKLLLKQNDVMMLPPGLQKKILSGKLIEKISEKVFAKKNAAYMQSNNLQVENENWENVVLYFANYPAGNELQQLDNLGIKYYPGTWTPPLPNHPLGFFIAKVPTDNFISALSLEFIKKVGYGEQESVPNNNEASKKIKSDLVWAQGWTGTGIKVAILDSGLDTDPPNSDLPPTIEARDYSYFPDSIDNNVENMITGHGTHVTGSVLGRGVLSQLNAGNGGGSFKGSAPGADLVFLKIGDDETSSSSADGTIAAIHAAVDTFHADILSMSYGGWGEYHDGSSAEEQTVDWAYSQGKPFFISAGNEGSSKRHFSGTVPANDTTDFIKIDVTGAGTNNTYLYFNLVWVDDTSHSNLSLEYYNASMVMIPSLEFGITESPRGTESSYSYYNGFPPSGNSTWYLKVVNPSGHSQSFHIYESWNNQHVKFNAFDPDYTIGQPASADNAFSIGAFVSRTTWAASNGSGNYHYLSNEVLDSIASFSSRGPRVDGMVEPFITSPGSAIISMRDRDVYTSVDASWVDNDGVTAMGDADYYVLQGTSMACPIAAGAAALYLSKYPGYTPLQLYTALKNNAFTDSYTGLVPNNIWGNGKLDINAAINDSIVPVELTSFTAMNKGDKNILAWQTATELNNYGFEIQRASLLGGWEKIGFVNGHGSSSTIQKYEFIDKASGLNNVSYRLKQIDNNLTFKYSNIVEVTMLPVKYAIEQNYPNPFNPNTTIKYSLPVESNVKIFLYNVLGEKVAEIINQVQTAGYQQTQFNASTLSSGVYYYTIEAKDVTGEKGFNSVKKMMVLK